MQAYFRLFSHYLPDDGSAVAKDDVRYDGLSYRQSIADAASLQVVVIHADNVVGQGTRLLPWQEHGLDLHLVDTCGCDAFGSCLFEQSLAKSRAGRQVVIVEQLETGRIAGDLHKSFAGVDAELSG